MRQPGGRLVPPESSYVYVVPRDVVPRDVAPRDVVPRDVAPRDPTL